MQYIVFAYFTFTSVSASSSSLKFFWTLSSRSIVYLSFLSSFFYYSFNLKNASILALWVFVSSLQNFRNMPRWIARAIFELPAPIHFYVISAFSSWTVRICSVKWVTLSMFLYFCWRISSSTDLHFSFRFVTSMFSLSISHFNWNYLLLARSTSFFIPSIFMTISLCVQSRVATVLWQF